MHCRGFSSILLMGIIAVLVVIVGAGFLLRRSPSKNQLAAPTQEFPVPTETPSAGTSPTFPVQPSSSSSPATPNKQSSGSATTSVKPRSTNQSPIQIKQQAQNTSNNSSDFITCNNGNMRGGPVRVQKSVAGSMLENGPTDPRFIKVINPGKVIMADSRNTYLWNVNTNPIPIIAPANGTLIYIEYKTRIDIDPNSNNPDYDLAFASDCKTIYRINHITNPSDAIKAISRLKEPAKLGPGLPPNEQDSTPLKEFMVKAGEQLGTTTGTPAAHNWDFVAYVNRQAVCPYNLLPESQRMQWLNLLSSSDQPAPGTPCDVSGGI